MGDEGFDTTLTFSNHAELSVSQNNYWFSMNPMPPSLSVFQGTPVYVFRGFRKDNETYDGKNYDAHREFRYPKVKGNNYFTTIQFRIVGDGDVVAGSWLVSETETRNFEDSRYRLSSDGKQLLIIFDWVVSG